MTRDVYQVRHTRYVDRDVVDEFARLVSDYNPLHVDDAHLDRDDVRFDEPVVPTSMLTSSLSSAVGQLATHIETHTGREADVLVRNVDLETYCSVTTPVSLTFEAHLETRLLDVSQNMFDEAMESIVMEVDVRCARTLHDVTIADGQVSILADFLSRKNGEKN